MWWLLAGACCDGAQQVCRICPAVHSSRMQTAPCRQQAGDITARLVQDCSTSNHKRYAIAADTKTERPAAVNTLGTGVLHQCRYRT
jgi:hypothetical protein